MIYSNKIWISGADGRLGSKLVEMLNPVDVEILATDKDTVDVSVSSEVLILRTETVQIISSTVLPLQMQEDAKKIMTKRFALTV